MSMGMDMSMGVGVGVGMDVGVGTGIGVGMGRHGMVTTEHGAWARAMGASPSDRNPASCEPRAVPCVSLPRVHAISWLV